MQQRSVSPCAVYSVVVKELRGGEPLQRLQNYVKGCSSLMPLRDCSSMGFMEETLDRLGLQFNETELDSLLCRAEDSQRGFLAIGRP